MTAHTTRLLLLLATAGVAGCNGSLGPGPPVAASGPRKVFWQESFDSASPVGWESMSGANAPTVEAVYAVRDGVLVATHDATVGAPPPAVHWGRIWRNDAAPLPEACSLSWRWRVRQHPTVGDDAWDDVAASVYVIIRTPGVLSGGHGFKLAWLSKPGMKGTDQRGLKQIELRSDAASEAWQSETVDLCDLYRRHFGNSRKEKLLYVGVVSDADNTRSRVAADYDDFVVANHP